MLLRVVGTARDEGEDEAPYRGRTHFAYGATPRERVSGS